MWTLAGLDEMTDRSNRTPAVERRGDDDRASERGKRLTVARRIVHQALPLLIGGIGIYVVLPRLLSAVTEWQSLSHIVWPFVVLTIVCQTAAFACIWALDRIVLHTKSWFPVIASQLTSAAAGRVLPGGGATAMAFVVSMLRRAGIETPDAAAAWGTSTLLQTTTTLALPVLALPAIIGGAQVNRSLATAAILGAVLFVLLLAAGALAFTTDKPIELFGRVLQWLLNATIRRHDRVTNLPDQLLGARDSVRTTLGRRWKAAIGAAAGSTLFDYLALLAALRAVGAEPRPSLVLLAYTAGQVLALIPITPGGLGFVEGGLVAMLKLAGVPVGEALAATLVYRMASYWLPLPAGGIAYLLFRRRYPDTDTGSLASPGSP